MIKENNFKLEFKQLRKEHGRSAGWIIKKWNAYARTYFHHKLSLNQFTEEEKKQIRKIIIE